MASDTKMWSLAVLAALTPRIIAAFVVVGAILVVINLRRIAAIVGNLLLLGSLAIAILPFALAFSFRE